MDLESYIRVVPDFPKKGIMFKDITPLLGSAEALRASIEALAEKFSDVDYDLIVGPESRGFIFGVGLATLTNKGFVPIRKPGKLPSQVESVSYELEYGSDTLEIHKDAVKRGQRVLVIDDLLATGGTMDATLELLEKLGAEIVGCGFLIELSFLNGREKLRRTRVESVLSY